MSRLRLVDPVASTGFVLPNAPAQQQKILILPVTGSGTIRRIIEHPHLIRDVSLVVAGILVFSLFIHDPLPLQLIAFAGLAVSAFILTYSIRKQSLAESFGILPFSGKMLYFVLPAIIMGAGLAWLTRITFDLSPFPASLSGFAFIAPLIGATEELIFRGYIQGHLRSIGRIFSIVYAASVHTCYKLLVILSLSVPLQFDFFFLVIWTFVGGLAFGLLREGSRNVLLPVMAHAVFDIILYGSHTLAPVWVWS